MSPPGPLRRKPCRPQAGVRPNVDLRLTHSYLTPMAAFDQFFRWRHLPDHVARVWARTALRQLGKAGGGPFSHKEIREIVEDVMELPQHECDVRTWNKWRCRTLIVRLLVRGLTHDPQLFTYDPKMHYIQSGRSTGTIATSFGENTTSGVFSQE